MTWLVSIGLHNAALTTLLALLVWGITRVWNNPPAAHLLWLLVLLKLVTPPLVNLDSGNWAALTDVGASNSAAPATVDGSRSFPAAPATASESNPARDEAASAAAGEGPPAHEEHLTMAAIWRVIGPALPWIWVGGTSLIALTAGIRIIRFQRTLAGTLPASQRLRATADELAIRIGLGRTPDVRIADSAVAPLVWCAGGRATIVLPLRLLAMLSEQQIAMVLAHELAHLRRRDHWVRVLELAVSVVYWWNPLVWWVRRQLHAAEEQCCDAWVTWIFPGESRDYAESLLKAAELWPANSPGAALASPFLNAQTLKERIEMVLKSRSPRMTSRSAAVCVVLLAAVVIPTGIRGAAEAGHEQLPAVPTAVQVAQNPPGKVPTGPTPPVQNDNDPPAVAQEKRLPDELKPWQGTFKVTRWWRSDKWPAKPAEFQTWRWTIKGQEIVWQRPKQEDLRLSFTVDASKSPQQIDLTFLNGPDKGEKCLGIFFASRHQIQLTFQEPGAKVERPTSQPGSGHTSLLLDRADVLPVAEEIAALQGVWKFDMYYSDWWPEKISDPPISWSKWRWTVKGNEITWTGMKVPDVKLSFTLDPTKSPRQIDMTFLDGPHKGKKLLGMYEFFADDGCHVCFADPEAKIARPIENAYSRDLGQTMVSIERVPPKTPAAESPPPKEKAADRGPEIDAAIARLRKQGAMVREFHPRGHPEYWVQVTSHNFDDENLKDVEIISRGVPLYFHLNHSSVTPSGLERLASSSRIGQLELSGDNIDDALLKSLPKLPLQGQLGLYSEKLTDAGIKVLAECRQLGSVTLDGKQLSNACLENLVSLPKLQRVELGKNFTRGRSTSSADSRA